MDGDRITTHDFLQREMENGEEKLTNASIETHKEDIHKRLYPPF